MDQYSQVQYHKVDVVEEPVEGIECVVLYDYAAELPDELSLRVGDVITGVERLEGGWWKGELGGKQGVFPDNFVKVSKFLYPLLWAKTKSN